MSWVETYQRTDTMDINNLKELLSTIGLPFEGKKRDLISYFIFHNWKELIPPPIIKSKDRGLGLEKLYFSKVSFPHDAINDENIFNHFPSIRNVVSARDFTPHDWNEE